MYVECIPSSSSIVCQQLTTWYSVLHLFIPCTCCYYKGSKGSRVVKRGTSAYVLLTEQRGPQFEFHSLGLFLGNYQPALNILYNTTFQKNMLLTQVLLCIAPNHSKGLCWNLSPVHIEEPPMTTVKLLVINQWRTKTKCYITQSPFIATKTAIHRARLPKPP